MNISDRNIPINNTSNVLAKDNMVASPAIDKVAGNIQNAKENPALVRLVEGQTFQGNIINITGNEVQIMLEDNVLLQAHMQDAVNINIGDFLSFLVQEKNSNDIVIRPVSIQDSSIYNQAIQKALEANHFLPTEKNYTIAKTLMEYGMPLDKATMQQIMQQAVTYNHATIDTLVHMNKMGLRVNSASIDQFHSYVEGTHQLANAITDFSSSICSFSSEMLMHMATDPSVTPSEFMNFHTSFLDGIIKDTNMEDDFFPTELPVSNEAEELSPASSKAFAHDFLQKLSAFLEAAKQENGSVSSTKLLSQVNKALTEAIHSSAIEISKDTLALILDSKEYNLLLNASLKQELFLNKASFHHPDEIDSLYERVYALAKHVMESFPNMGEKAGDEMQKQADSMKQRIDFIQNLNDMYAYAQLPVKLSDDAFHSELFVYMNKKKQQLAKEDVSALLHLDMEYLGATDVHVSLHGSTVHTKFYVEDPVSARILDAHMSRLEKAVAQKGFSLTNEVVMREVSITGHDNMVVNALMDCGLEKSIKRYTFDIRM